MNLYILILAFSIVEAYSYERFIKTANGPKTIHCDQNSFLFTNATKYMNSCNDDSSCQIRSSYHHVNYVCIKRKFEKSTCTLLTHYSSNVNQTGCYIGDFTRNFEITLPKTDSKIFHVFLLYKSLRYQDTSSKMFTCPAFCYHKCRSPCRLNIDGDSRILFKASYKSEEDFKEFFMEDNPKTTLGRKGEDTTPLITFASTKSTLQINKSTLQINKNTGENSSTTETPRNGFKANKVIIILGAVVIVFMIIFVLVAFIFYRYKIQEAKKTPKIGTTNDANEFPLSGNEANDVNTCDSIVLNAEQDFDKGQYSSVENVLYVTSNSVDRSQLKAQNQSGNKESALASDAVYAVVNKQNVIRDNCSATPGGSVDRSQLKAQNQSGNKESAPGPDAVYAVVNKQNVIRDNCSATPGGSVDRSQLKAQNQSGNKESAPGPDAVYAVVNKQNVIKDDCSGTPGGSPHVVVNGDIYAVVSKEKSDFTFSL